MPRVEFGNVVVVLVDGKTRRREFFTEVFPTKVVGNVDYRNIGVFH